MDSKPASSARRKGIYILPNLFTTATLFGGFYAIVMAMGGHFESACRWKAGCESSPSSIWESTASFGAATSSA